MSAPVSHLPSRRAGGETSGKASASRRGLASADSDRRTQDKPNYDGHGQQSSKLAGSGDKGSDAGAKTIKVGDNQKRSKQHSSNEGEKLVIRRLPPGMTEAEFLTILGSDWALNQGKVDWFSYCAGKITSDLSKPSRPSRAYLHLIRKDDIMALSQAVRAATWEDAKSTFTGLFLVGPPSLEFSTYKKIPSSRRRIDPRQGTIDQDQEFMAFLEDLANPVPIKESTNSVEADELSKDDAKIITTPLVEYLREKKANKGKEAASGKNTRTGQSKGKGTSKEDESGKKKGKEPKAEKAIEKSTKEPVKILMKKPTTEPTPEASRNALYPTTTANAADAPKSRRAGIAAAARILQRDLGLSPGTAHRRARHDAAKAEAESKGTSTKDTVAPASETQRSETDNAALAPTTSRSQSPVSAKTQAPVRGSRGVRATGKGRTADISSSTPIPTPMLLRKRVENEASPATTAAQPASNRPAANGKSAAPSANLNNAKKSGGGNKVSFLPKKGPSITTGATRAFVKHANPSQGVTEAALRQALEAFGSVTLVEVDKRKGFAYVDFSEHAGLVKAVGASPVQVAQTAIQVLERKDKKLAASSGSTKTSDQGPGRGRRGRGGGGGGSNTVNGVSNNSAATASATTGG